MSNGTCVYNSYTNNPYWQKFTQKEAFLESDGRSSGKGLHQAAIVVYPVVKDFGRIVRPHNYKIEEQRK